MATVIFEETIEIPGDIRTLQDFQRWLDSPDFPDHGRIDFFNGRIEINMSPESLYTHGAVKGAIFGALQQFVQFNELGEIFVDSTRLTSTPHNLSVEPDILFFSNETLASGQLQFKPKSGRNDDITAVEGPADLVVEVVSDGSVSKDMRRLPESYFRAGVKEYWLVDARREELMFEIYRRGSLGFIASVSDSEKFLLSEVFGVWFHLIRQKNRHDHWEYRLLQKSK